VISSLRFEISTAVNDPAVAAVEVVVNGVSLATRVAQFEMASGWTPAGGYAGLIPSSFRFGDARTHWLAQSGSVVSEGGKIPLLGCVCGEWGCWPLLARVEATPDTIGWESFEQPFRPSRDYSNFGPFLFDRSQYANEVAVLAQMWDPAQA
jgi:hypothetical protein